MLIKPRKNRADWADDEEFDDPSALPAQQVTTNKDGTKTVISYRFNDEGKKVKVTRRIKTTVVREHVNPQVAERKTWAKFGLEKGHAAGPSFDTTSVGENIIFRPSINWKAQAAEAEKNGGEKGSIKDQLKDKKVKCRICSGEHFTARCPFKDTMAPVDEPGAAGAGEGADADEGPGGLGVGGGSYVPPHLRKGAASGGERMAGKYEKDDLATLRVTNVCLPSSCLLGILGAGKPFFAPPSPSFNSFFSLFFSSCCFWLVAGWLTVSRFPSLRRNKNSGICSSASVVSPEFSWPGTEKPREQRALHSSASRIGATPHVPATRWTDVRTLAFRSPSTLVYQDNIQY